MVFLDTIRGPHSTGLATVDVKKRESSIYKTMLSGDAAIKTKSWQDARDLWDGVLIGHNRYATQGAINLANAHPFRHGDITGVHNGSLDWGWEYYLQDTLGAPEFGTDSESILWAINEYGIEEAIKYVGGDYALVWYDSDSHTMNFINNGTRPLHYCPTWDGKALYFSSLAEIMWTLEAQGRSSAATLGVAKPFRKDVLYTLELPDKVLDFSFKKDKWEFEKTELKGGSECTNTYYYTYEGTDAWKWQNQAGYVVGPEVDEEPIKPTKTTDLSNKEAMDVYVRFLKRNSQRLDNEQYVSYIFRKSPTDLQGYETLVKNYTTLEANTTLMYPEENIKVFTKDVMKKFVTRLNDLQVMKDQMEVYEGTWEYYEKYHQDDGAEELERLTMIRSKECWNCHSTDVAGLKGWKTEDCAFFNDGMGEGFLCPDCKEIPCFQPYLDQLKA